MLEKTETKNIGLRGIKVADTKISLVDGDNGALYYRGYNIVDLAKNSTFEETAYLLLNGELPTRKQLVDFASQLAAERDVPDAIVQSMSVRPANASPMSVIQSTVTMLADYDPDLRDESREANHRRAVQLIAKMPAMIAYWERIRKKRGIIKPDPNLSHAANFLYMISGRKPGARIASVLDTCLVLHADHTFNASTFAAREVASTRAHMFAAVSAAVGALSGELHGGANERVMEMLMQIKEPGRVDAWVRNELQSGRLIFGMGHAVYRTNDPRALV
ncbi:MAG: citrate/2-methylcitrate synthase, partial [bacterium]